METRIPWPCWRHWNLRNATSNAQSNDAYCVLKMQQEYGVPILMESTKRAFQQVAMDFDLVQQDEWDDTQLNGVVHRYQQEQTNLIYGTNFDQPCWNGLKYQGMQLVQGEDEMAQRQQKQMTQMRSFPARSQSNAAGCNPSSPAAHQLKSATQPFTIPNRIGNGATMATTPNTNEPGSPVDRQLSYRKPPRSF